MPSSTAFVVEGGKAAVQSFQPCHIFGDGDIYGVGVRVSFYIQFFSSIAALAANIDECITLKQEAPVQQAINQLVEIEYQEYQLVQLWSAGEDDQGRLDTHLQ
ncbi:hypothetical protein M7I_3090 [Glarea lozoyensis 74030]|uniref:Uncharacterized protein n=1 Tax=Glarea lozoyensis (strain ATCC 74030 / MF5533) TaxID=1104152 RepID=H0EKJ2_GLAL7|nr:hypothetical protein M7I_3090 [Glarea lozoyensis 74030]